MSEQTFEHRDPLGWAKADAASWRILAELCRERAEKAEAKLLTALVAFYRVDSLAVADLCDDTLDRSGALLRRVRDAAVVGLHEEREG